MTWRGIPPKLMAAASDISIRQPKIPLHVIQRVGPAHSLESVIDTTAVTLRRPLNSIPEILIRLDS